MRSISQKILMYDQVAHVAQTLHAEGKKIVLVSGSYDLVHPGHLYFFEEAKKLGDILIVSVGSDEQIETLKGASMPVMKEELRLRMVAALEPVDFAVLSDEEMPMPSKLNFAKLAILIQPDTFALNDTDSAVNEKRRWLEKQGIELKLIKTANGPDISTTKLISRAKAS